MLTLTIQPQSLAVCRLAAEEPLPGWATQGPFSSVTRAPEELSVVCPWDDVPEGVKREGPWACFKVEGPLDFALTGILASLTAPLAKDGIPVFALSTYDTDYLLVREDQRDAAAVSLLAAGFDLRQ
ncbi:MAG TPA: ACT domain-containing protein [Aggregicoccus sp.]|nr:ACT domain-containing protein [Aggregicoccus sp.]